MLWIITVDVLDEAGKQIVNTTTKFAADVNDQLKHSVSASIKFAQEKQNDMTVWIHNKRKNQYPMVPENMDGNAIDVDLIQIKEKIVDLMPPIYK